MFRKLPYLYEEILQKEKCDTFLTDRVMENDEVIPVPEEFLEMEKTTRDMDGGQIDEWFNSYRENLPDKVGILDTANPNDIVPMDFSNIEMLMIAHRFNDFRHLNTYFRFLNYKLTKGACIVLYGETSGMRRARIMSTHPPVLRKIACFFDYLWSRVFPKLIFTRWFYMWTTKGQNRNLPRVEILGRVCRAGFVIAGEFIRGDEYVAAAVKVSEPIEGDKPSYGPLVRLRRVGYKGELINIHKFRTMYSYSEYLQKYAYQRLGLQSGGKLKDDFRVNVWGKIFRPAFIDELPMLFDWLCRRVKLVGVRPLSRQYFGLYTPEMQELRIKVKPGLIPPFYYEKVIPVTLDDIQESEKRYIEAYLKAPFRTDCRYFFGSIFNIIFRHHHSR